MTDFKNLLVSGFPNPLNFQKILLIIKEVGDYRCVRIEFLVLLSRIGIGFLYIYTFLVLMILDCSSSSASWAVKMVFKTEMWRKGSVGNKMGRTWVLLRSVTGPLRSFGSSLCGQNLVEWADLVLYWKSWVRQGKEACCCTYFALHLLEMKGEDVLCVAGMMALHWNGARDLWLDDFFVFVLDCWM